ncbi:uncharacterized protein ColSpa_08786 [Colletotrichum spaethianum]|uniref:Uncharacterized protein n=1 Tax=Colletotrichum spaethianum TaxID=700344 RepID=A0AA37PAC7_9PEZI|nr:uncharacterized protein ColSpa_08786 [Colletotrichum spaethianum]GKT48605.1 hypothetical protein ColSpa_08786 [Colletotrichum spaethianum]
MRTLAPTFSSSKVRPETTFTFVTTAKNPSVIFSPVSTPRYGHDSETKALQDKQTAAEPTAKPQPSNDQRPTNPPGWPRESAKEPPKATYKVTVAPTTVIINDQTFKQENPSETKRVTVSGAEFVINPSEVLGGGTVIDRPGNVGRSTMVPSSTEVGGLPVVVAPAGTQDVVVVGGTTLQVQATPVTIVVRGQKVTVQPSAIVFPRQTVSISRTSPAQTEIVVAGGEMVSAIGPSVVVIRSTTFTYGLVSSTITKVVDDDTILIGPSGVSVRNVTVGGPNAKTSDSAYEIVGGATVTQAGASVVVVDGTSFTVGPGRGITTKVFGGESITIGPSGVVISTLTLAYPFGPTVITSVDIDVATTAAAPSPVPSVTKKKNGGAAARHATSNAGIHFGFCIAICAWVLGRMV